MRLRRRAADDYPGVTGADLVRLERERARTIHEWWVHRPQFVGVVALGAIGVLCVICVLLVVLLSKKGTDFATAVSVLGSVAAAAVGGIAGMLTGRSHQETHGSQAGGAAVPAGERVDQPEGCGEQPELP